MTDYYGPPRSTVDTCPECGGDAACGFEYRGTYDGVLIWECASAHRWPRFPEGTILHDEARQILESER